MNDPADQDTVTTDTFRRIRRIFEEALERPAGKRRAFVENACAGDAAILREVNRMLDAEGQADPLLDGLASAPPSSSAPEEGRFPAGTVLAGRYRILGLLGTGGMGEVYKAFDLILNQTVALKFLNPAHISEAALIRFRNEVRIARQVSHPNVCRVYDLGMVEGLHFLSMEYIDGEDLASLLRRIGRLPQDKAIEFTRKICAGLGAAHERGVLHRDLKPANIMIDGRGQVRITDFGLAALAAEIPLSDLRSGTPAYMSPEQKAGKEVTTRSDIYSLGLVLHEMFTGKARKDTQSSPSELVKDLDPAIERLILRCLEEDPKRRPQTPLNVAMGLPGADPIAAALAAGETPSPEMVAASEEKEGFSTLTAVLCFAAMVLALVAHAVVEQRWGVFAHAQMPYPPQVLADRAQHLLNSMGYTEPPLSVSYGLDTDQRAIDNLARYDASRRMEVLASHQPPTIIFWHRQNQVRPASTAAFAPDEPDPAGSVRLTLDAQSRLVELSVRPWQVAHESSGPVAATVDWPALFSAAGLNMGRFTSEPPEAIPPMMADSRLSWAGTYGESRLERVRVNAASWRGRPVLFEVLSLEGTVSNGFTSFLGYFLVVVPLMVLVAAVVAFRNVRQSRVDRRGAAVIGGTALALGFALPIRTGPVNIPFLSVVGVGVLEAGGLWLLYVAIEPYVRRNWPDSLISWSRFCAGRVRNALVASHILAGLVLVFSALAVRSVLMASFTTVFLGDVGALDNFGNGAVSLLGGYTIGAPLCLGALLLVVLLRLGVRRVWIADGIAALLLQFRALTFFGSGPWPTIVGLTFFSAVFLAALWLLRRLGFLAFLVFWVFFVMLSPQVFIPTGWTAGASIGFRVIPLAVAAWALWVIISTERRPSTESAA